MAHERGDLTSHDVRPGETTSVEELQRLLRVKRESITQTVEEIKMNMQTGFHDTKDKVTETLDWRMQMQRYPLASVAGALAVGFLAGQMLGRTMGGGSSRSGRMMGSSSFGAGTSLAPGSSSTVGSSPVHREPRHFISPQAKSKVVGRFEDVLTDIAENFLTEVSRVGRDIIVPTIVSNLTGAFTHEQAPRGASSTGSSSMHSGSSSYSPKSTTESSSFSSPGMASGSTAAGGPISSSSTEGGSSRFQGRGI